MQVPWYKASNYGALWGNIYVHNYIIYAQQLYVLGWLDINCDCLKGVHVHLPACGSAC